MVQEVESAHQVRLSILVEMLQGISNRHAGRQMKDRIHAVQRLADHPGIQDVSLKEPGTRWNVFPLAHREVVQNVNGIPALKKFPDNVRTNEAGATGHQNPLIFQFDSLPLRGASDLLGNAKNAEAKGKIMTLEEKIFGTEDLEQDSIQKGWSCGSKIRPGLDVPPQLSQKARHQVFPLSKNDADWEKKGVQVGDAMDAEPRLLKLPEDLQAGIPPVVMRRDIVISPHETISWN
jgi:hypothetical protein